MTLWIKIFIKINVFIYRLSRGRLGSRMAGQALLLLHTAGRKSGKVTTTPLSYYRDGENFVIVAANFGRDRHPAWYWNLLHQPVASIQVKERTICVRARAAAGEEYARLWAAATAANESLVRFQKQTEREFPLLVLTPVV
jgi:deazaflavin-dependent oxidoreductase (nitroreductase family)